jgi:hypothetical protein
MVLDHNRFRSRYEVNSYEAQPDVWQMYIDCASCSRSELQCGEYLKTDYEAEPAELSSPKNSGDPDINRN